MRFAPPLICLLSAAAVGYGQQVAVQQIRTAQLAFTVPVGMHVQWDVKKIGAYDSAPLVVPGRHNFPLGGVYGLKLSKIPGQKNVELYVTMEISAESAQTEEFLTHCAIPVPFSEEDVAQALSGKSVTKVIFWPRSEFRAMALAGAEMLVSTQLAEAVDPIVEADRRGMILAIVRLGNKRPEIP